MIAAKKIHIIGEVGSGKTYLAKRLSEALNLPHYQLDNIVWSRGIKKDTRNPDELRDEILNNLVKKDSWIIEGVHYKWVINSLSSADMIIYLDLKVYQRDKQIISRFIKQRLGMEKGNFKQSFAYLYRLIRWSHNFEKVRKPKIAEFLASFEDKILYFNNNEEAIKKLTQLRE
ncbi:P-loop NTPase family protein [Paenibacillus psychroresistens]|uniref:DNA topology modulation protein FlaR n=1 Tax=Paenibacillus psychroresistens TaxID=1778678 RepID=UPI00187763A6|nr:DNA topology modulation protein FlaR [Paenibacillus psychroresistens]